MHKVTYVADGHNNDIHLEGVYSGVVTLRVLRMFIFIV